MTVVGPGDLLATFQADFLDRPAYARSIHVHGMYHGGAQLSSVYHEVLADVRRRGLDLPKLSDLKIPLRTLQGGSILLPGDSQHIDILDLALRSILLDSVDWRVILAQIEQTYLQQEGTATEEVTTSLVAIGPQAAQFFRSAAENSRIQALQIVERSSPSLLRSPNSFDDQYAVVGLSVKFPQAGNKNELWDLLEQGRCTAEKVTPNLPPLLCIRLTIVRFPNRDSMPHNINPGQRVGALHVR